MTKVFLIVMAVAAPPASSHFAPETIREMPSALHCRTALAALPEPERARCVVARKDYE
jgi:hypothetical protein